ncbi:MAG: hypothetical protein H6766_01860 [Candidatus Peribacteria bacterium]|nr:MAG: hypothetical protein H6766_01860 [Candidatus Peribacteria bacterium]
MLRALADGEWHKPSWIAQRAGITRPTANKYLAKLLDEKKIQKQGSGPHVQYHIADMQYIPENTPPALIQEHDFDYQQSSVLDDYFLKYDADGNELQGVQGFLMRCQQRNMDPYQKFPDYLAIQQTLTSLYNHCGVLDALDEFAKHVDELALDGLYYADQYRWNEFGRSKLAEMAFFAKQLQYVYLMQDALGMILRKLECVIKTEKVDAIALTPPSITRQHQLLDVLDEMMNFTTLPRIRLVKDYPTAIKTPQKSLRKRADRVRNAKNSIHVYDDRVSQYRHVLLIDDFVGSGATLNETAKKLKAQGVEKVTGFAIVGNLDLSYDVIQEI